MIRGDVTTAWRLRWSRGAVSHPENGHGRSGYLRPSVSRTCWPAVRRAERLRIQERGASPWKLPCPARESSPRRAASRSCRIALSASDGVHRLLEAQGSGLLLQHARARHTNKLTLTHLNP